MRNILQRILIRFIIKDIFHAMTVEDILAIKGGKWTWKGKELDDDTKGKLQMQAKNFHKSLLWATLKSEIQWVATKTLLEQGQTGNDLRIAQMQGYVTKVINDKLLTMSDGSQ